MLGSGLTFFVLSSDYRVGQINEFYYLTKLLNVSYSDFLKMPVFFRKYLLDKWVKENTKD